ncbi:MAG: hypothetical protein EKK48_27305 [Candidatus Melainabacteria bacterium]|nr:MAG: hypothetical protein EKK48_27305 [Candidatus Melainabacteria bacterium]
MRTEVVSDVVLEDGTRVITKANMTIVIISPDGKKEIRKPDEGVVQMLPDGTRIYSAPDGTISETRPKNLRPLNVISTSADENAQLLSNFAHTPFILDDVRYQSVEGFYVGLKYSNQDERRKMNKLFGAEAKRAGKAAKPTETEYGGTTIKLGSTEHHALIKRAIKAKIEQNQEVLKALLDSYPRELVHLTGRPDPPNTNFPSSVFVRILTELRDEFMSRQKQA